jgi:hypothetical protein
MIPTNSYFLVQFCELTVPRNAFVTKQFRFSN